MYYSHPEIQRKRNRNAFKLPVAEDVLAAVRRNFTREIEFYEFCRQRLNRQHEELEEEEEEETQGTDDGDGRGRSPTDGKRS